MKISEWILISFCGTFTVIISEVEFGGLCMNHPSNAFQDQGNTVIMDGNFFMKNYFRSLKAI